MVGFEVEKTVWKKFLDISHKFGFPLSAQIFGRDSGNPSPDCYIGKDIVINRRNLKLVLCSVK